MGGLRVPQASEIRMPTLIGGLLALVALATSVFVGVDPLSCIIRGAIAYLVGVACTQLWYVFFAARVLRREEPK
jgi:hypothetical protein